ncbi:MAG: hypothetical protein K8I01_12225 [Candidatus Methylomirabilis sp.]|nr:hypothetical protein [Deltaproteobacteria bacterium]
MRLPHIPVLAAFISCLLALKAPCQYVYVGTDSNDYLGGASSSDSYFGLFGDDYLSGGDGFDDLYGDEGNDLIIGGGDDDYLCGGEGSDVLYDDDGWDIFSTQGDGEQDWIYCVDGEDGRPDVVECGVEDTVYCDNDDIIAVWDWNADLGWHRVFFGSGAEYYDWLAAQG